MKNLYLYINLFSVLCPFLFSFHKGMRWIKHIKEILFSFFCVSLIYLSWDIYFTKHQVWGFNLDYCIGITFFGMPLEEYLFFFCIPFASLFIHYVWRYYFPKIVVSASITKFFAIAMLCLSIVLIAFNISRIYTVVNFSILVISILLALRYNFFELQRFLISYVFILIPFIIVNGILTGSGIDKPVVWYNNEENLGIRFFTIPVEDFAYAFSMLMLSLLLIEFLNKKNNNIPNEK